MTSRYIFTPMTARRIGWRLKPWEKVARFFRLRKHREEPDVFPIVGCFAPIFPGK